MIITDWLAGRKLRVDVKNEPGASKKQVHDQAQKMLPSGRIKYPENASRPKSYKSTCEQWHEDREHHRNVMYRESQNKRKVNGKQISGFGNRNLKLLDEGRRGSLIHGYGYNVALVTDLGEDRVVPWQPWEYSKYSSMSLIFDIPANTTIVGVFVYEGGEVIQAARVEQQSFKNSGTYTLNVSYTPGLNG